INPAIPALDLAGIAGLIAAVGTGVDDQIVITDEVLRGEKEEKVRSIKERIKRAFFIIIVSFASTVATMLPLTFAGAGLLRGFAITTIIAVSIGIFITRPAYARLIELLLR
ncbi:MAG: protein translocase subunit SecD, partial [Nanoarchaeota archaeon]|nr:protein translocase subunit SecD [Nanoarchaeota archaeon]